MKYLQNFHLCDLVVLSYYVKAFWRIPKPLLPTTIFAPLKFFKILKLIPFICKKFEKL